MADNIMQAGMFAILLGGAVIFMILSFKFSFLLRVVSCVMFFALAIVLLAQYDVAFTSTSETTIGGTNATSTSIKYIIQGDTGVWLGWICMILGIFTGFLFFIELIGEV